MIQLRWIQGPPGQGRGLLGGSEGQMYENILQYRYIVGMEAVEAFQTMPRNPIWSEWTDAFPPGKSPR